MAINLVTQEMMDLSSIKQEPIRLGHQTFVELFDDPDVSEELKHNIAWEVAHFITLNGRQRRNCKPCYASSWRNASM